MPRRAIPIILNPDEKSHLLSLAQSRTLPHGLVQRARIVLACAEGEPGNVIAERLRLNKNTVAKWRKAMPSMALKGCTTNCVPGARAATTMNVWPTQCHFKGNS